MSADAVELKKLVKTIQNTATSHESILDILQNLKKNYVVTEVLLRESKAGLAVGKLRTHSDPQVASLAKELVGKWKAEVQKAKETPSRRASVSVPTPSTPTPKPKPAVAQASANARDAKKDGVTFNTGDNVRDKCSELVYNSLAWDTEACHSTAGDYKARVRTIFTNLKDRNNPQLCQRVISGDISPRRLTQMTPSAEVANIEKTNLFKTLAAGEQEAETEGFQCGRCKQRKCRYRQAQTRSADEPMTTFVTCVNCGNKWKFS
ncbi:transcription elongation factor [Flagelloscypha sp. PMI_526]|nr:transcription elongation factor [Flagelloscypha sp. PMI_526]